MKSQERQKKKKKSFSTESTLSADPHHLATLGYRGPYSTLEMHGEAFVRPLSEITREVLSPLIAGSASPCSLAINIQTSSERLLSYLGEAPRGPAVQTGRQVAYSERRGEEESAEVHANAATALIKRGASRFCL